MEARKKATKTNQAFLSIKPFFAQLGSFMILAMFEILGSIFSFSPKKFTQFLTSGIL